MATTNLIKMQIQFRRDTSANWEKYKDTVIPAAGEPCFEIDTGILKIGNGTSTYGDLPAIHGAQVSADDKSIILTDGAFKLAGFDAAETGAQPRKNAEGKLEWFVPAEVNTEALEEAVATLQSDVAELKNKMDGTGEGSVDAKIAEKINEFATDISDDGIVNSYKELIAYVAEHGGEAATMAADITDLQKLVGEVPVSEQISTAIAGVGGSGEANVIEKVKLGDTELEVVDETITVPVGAGLKASEEVLIGDDGALRVGTISFDKITNSENAVVVLDGGSAN